MLNQSPDLDLVFHALSDPTRRRIVQRLSEGPASASELAQPLPMSLSAVMQHLQILQQAGLVRSHKTGRVRHYHMQKASLSDIEQWIADRRRDWEQRCDRLEEFLNENTKIGDAP